MENTINAVDSLKERHWIFSSSKKSNCRLFERESFFCSLYIFFSDMRIFKLSLTDINMYTNRLSLVSMSFARKTFKMFVNALDSYKITIFDFKTIDWRRSDAITSSPINFRTFLSSIEFLFNIPKEVILEVDILFILHIMWPTSYRKTNARFFSHWPFNYFSLRHCKCLSHWNWVMSSIASQMKQTIKNATCTHGP